MPDLTIEHVSKRFGGVTALDDVSLSLPEGELICFLGPSGCGKTTLLRILAGLETPGRGRVVLGGDDITGLPAHRRGFGMVFQSLALFDHLNVGDNIAYPLAVRGQDRRRRRERVAELLSMVRLDGMEGRHIAQLSGGQRQRVAIARALAMAPDVFLLDEPLSALDAKLREAMQIELRLLQRRLGVTTVLVTHDQREAMTLADRIVVMSDQRIQQIGAPGEIYRRPANRFVADFIGAGTLIAGTWRGDAAETAIGIIRATPPEDPVADGEAITVLVRPEDVTVAPATGETAETGEVTVFDGRVSFVRDLGSTVEIMTEIGDQTVLSMTPADRLPDLVPGDRAKVILPADRCRVLTS